MSKASSDKTDAMRAQREARYAAQQRAVTKPTPSAAPPPARPVAAPPSPEAPASKGSGRCTGCGALRALKGGLVVTHRINVRQGSKVHEGALECPGSRKPPEGT